MDWLHLEYNFLLKHIIEVNIEERRIRRRKRKQILYDLHEATRYWKLNEEVLDRNLWRTRFGGGNGPVVRHIT
jgi:hypothetical protein